MPDWSWYFLMRKRTHVTAKHQSLISSLWELKTTHDQHLLFPMMHTGLAFRIKSDGGWWRRTQDSDLLGPRPPSFQPQLVSCKDASQEATSDISDVLLRFSSARDIRWQGNWGTKCLDDLAIFLQLIGRQTRLQAWALVSLSLSLLPSYSLEKSL